MRKLIRISVMAILLMSLVGVAFRIEKVQASGTIYIRADGSIDPSTAPISTVDNITYTLTDDIVGDLTEDTSAIVVERDNIVVDGAGHILQRTGAIYSKGIELTGRNNVTIKNMEIKTFYYGIHLRGSSNNTISGNNITNNYYGIYLYQSSNNNTISGNSFVDDGLYIQYSYWNIVVGNLVNGKPLVYLEDASDLVVEDAGQVILVNCSRIRVENLSLSNTAEGVQLWKTYNTTITGNNITNTRGGVRLYSSSNNTLSGNNITNNYYGVVLYGSSNNNFVSGNNITSNHSGGGLYLYGSPNNTISGNNITSNNGGAVYFYSSSNNNTLSGNSIANNGGGVRLYSSSNNSISGNNITSNNDNGVYLHASSNNIISGNSFIDDGLIIYDSFRNVVVGNLVNGKPLCYLEGASDLVVEDAGQVILVNCSRIRVENLNLSNTEVGVQLWKTYNTTITGNNITSNNEDGVSLYSSSNNTLSGNNISSNNDDGIELYFSSNNTIQGNNITNNDDGIELYHSYSNRVFHNNLINNTNQVYSSDSLNIWDDGYPSGGNYWSHLDVTDIYSGPFQNSSGSDGIRDTPYVVNSINQDKYPLIKPYGPSDIGITSIAASSTIAYQGYNLTITIKITNYGVDTEAFNLTTYANTTTIQTTTNIILSSRNSTTITLTWDTTSFAKDNYTISAVADPVPDETYTNDNTIVDGYVLVTLPGDVDGDRDVDIFDIVTMAGAYDSLKPGPPYETQLDIDNDGDIDIFDIVAAAGHYGESW